MYLLSSETMNSNTLADYARLPEQLTFTATMRFGKDLATELNEKITIHEHGHAIMEVSPAKRTKWLIPLD